MYSYFSRFILKVNNQCYYFSGKRRAHQRRGTSGDFINLQKWFADESLENAHRGRVTRVVRRVSPLSREENNQRQTNVLPPLSYWNSPSLHHMGTPWITLSGKASLYLVSSDLNQSAKLIKYTGTCAQSNKMYLRKRTRSAHASLIYDVFVEVSSRLALTQDRDKQKHLDLQDDNCFLNELSAQRIASNQYGYL